METIVQVFDKFLEAQQVRLKKTTFNRYKSVMQLFESYMNSYAYNYLEKKEQKLFWTKYKNEKKEFCEIFDIKKMTNSEVSEFLSYFMIRKVTGSKELMKNTGRVLRKFIKWLKDNSYIDNNKFEILDETINELKDDLPKVVELANIFYEEATKNSFRQYEIYKESHFIIKKVEAGKLWLEDYDYIDSDMKIGPVIVPEKISSFVREGWTAYLELGRKNKRWYITGSGNVYPN
ncbi:MAG: hypothetical protein QM401_02215 [Bacillota bacterium]|jgi:hypothetical protein|nr:hypothetical protein [Bacillota bacterium]